MLTCSAPVSAAARMRVTGRTAVGTVSVWRPGAAGCTAASGLRASKAATAYDSPPPLRPNTRAPGRMGCRTAMDQRRTPIQVRHADTPGQMTLTLHSEADCVRLCRHTDTDSASSMTEMTRTGTNAMTQTVSDDNDDTMAHGLVTRLRHPTFTPKMFTAATSDTAPPPPPQLSNILGPPRASPSTQSVSHSGPPPAISHRSSGDHAATDRDRHRRPECFIWSERGAGTEQNWLRRMNVCPSRGMANIMQTRCTYYLGTVVGLINKAYHTVTRPRQEIASAIKFCFMVRRLCWTFGQT